MTMKRVAVLGATGSIGMQALDVISRFSDKYSVTILACGSNYSQLKKQINKYRPNIAICSTATDKQLDNTIIYNDLSALNDATLYENSDIVINGIGGIAGLLPTWAVLSSSARLATANKESIVSAGQLIISHAKENNQQIIPIDSEHSALWQCLEHKNNIKKLILTASGGAFRALNKNQLAKAKAQDALKHPVWKMGKKVTIDSATLVNKAMEIIEAKWLFGIDAIDVVIHKESIVHGMVEYNDGAIKASLSQPDMRQPIQYALSYPQRESCLDSLDFAKLSTLSFEKPDYERFPCLSFGYDVISNPNLGAVFVAADEIAVWLYLKDKIAFYDIADIINDCFNKYKYIKINTLNDVLSIDKEIKEYTLSRYSFGGSN